jgi:hypothetical protein
MTPIYRDEIKGPSAWTPQSVGGKEGLVRTLSDKNLTAIDDLLHATRGLQRDDITREDFDHPALTPLLSDIRNEIMHGKGVAIVRGIDLARYTDEDRERIFCGFGTHWGEAAVQSRRADRLGYVRNEPDDPVARGYRGTGELVLHTDSRPIIALMSIQSAAQGGVSQLASGMTIHNIIRRERPDLLAPLYRGYPYLSNEIEMMLPSIPIFSNVNGTVSCYLFADHMRKAAKARGEIFPADLDEALHYFDSVSHREDVCMSFMLEPGEILISNNFVILHARTAFEDSAERKRLLLRLWLNVPDGRPTIPELLERSRIFDSRFDPRLASVA